MAIVEHMVGMAEITSDDVVYDLGCGDGRMVIEAARKHGARGIGFDLDSDLLEQAQANARAAGVDHLVTFSRTDVLTMDLSPASVVIMWTIPDMNAQLSPRLRTQLKPGARVVAHTFDLAEWPPAKTEFVEHENEMLAAYLWVVEKPNA
jgi:ribosomal protein L11 methylase PrmA